MSAQLDQAIRTLWELTAEAEQATGRYEYATPEWERWNDRLYWADRAYRSARILAETIREGSEPA